MNNNKIKFEDDINAVASLEDAHEYIKYGYYLWLNNLPDEAESHFKNGKKNTMVLAGYAIILCVNGIISYNVKVIENARMILKELEHRCIPSETWMSLMYTKLMGRGSKVQRNLQQQQQQQQQFQSVLPQNQKSLAAILEEQILLADSYLAQSLLTFLMQDVTGLVKAGWILRRAWKIYQNTYKQIYNLYIQEFDSDLPAPPLNFNAKDCVQHSKSLIGISQNTSKLNRQSESMETTLITTSSSMNSFDVVHQPINDIDELQLAVPSQTKKGKHNLYLKFQGYAQNHRLMMEPQQKTVTPPLIASPTNSIQQLLNQNNNDHKISSSKSEPETIDKQTIKRLMGGVSCGYGVLLLMGSLLPAKILRLISLFGFVADRNKGVSCLLFSHNTKEDMRSTISALFLLWYYAFYSQVIQYDDNIKDEIFKATKLIEAHEQEYANSAVFLFFKGRIERMKANVIKSLYYYEQAFNKTAQNELKLICHNEIGWCLLIQLDYVNATKRFNELRERTKLSRAFYTYMVAVCEGASGEYSNLFEYRLEICDYVKRTRKNSEIRKFIENRVKKLPLDEIALYKIIVPTNNKPKTELLLIANDQQTNISDNNNIALITKDQSKIVIGKSGERIQLYWKYLVYEMLILWNTMNNVSNEELLKIIDDCNVNENIISEPMIGLRYLILGSVNTYLKNDQSAINAYRNCIAKRNNNNNDNNNSDSNNIEDDKHITVFAHLELATLLLKNDEDVTAKSEAKKLLQDALLLKNYDLETRLVIRIQDLLNDL